MTGETRAMEPEDVTRLIAERLNAAKRRGVAALYEPEAVLAYPADRPTIGRAAIQAVYQWMVDAGLRFGGETPLPTVRFEGLVNCPGIDGGSAVPRLSWSRMTGFSCHCGGVLELYRREHARGAVAPGAVVEDLQVLKDCARRPSL